MHQNFLSHLCYSHLSGAESARTPAVSVTSPEGCDVEMKMIKVAVERMLSAEAGHAWDGR
jgi:hypothetical protein